MKKSPIRRSSVSSLAFKEATFEADIAYARTLVQGFLTTDLLKPEWRKQQHPLEGFCYVASEVLFYALGPEDWQPMSGTYDRNGKEAQHWWLVHKTTNRILDATSDQFWNDEQLRMLYEEGKPRAFLTKKPSRRARILIDRILRASVPVLSCYINMHVWTGLRTAYGLAQD